MIADAWSARADARFASDPGGPVAALPDPGPGERIPDLGCGDGALAGAIPAAGAEGRGVDASDMVAAARGRGLEAEVADGRAPPFEAECEAVFSAVFSNAALHWMTDPDAVFAGVARAVVPGGRFAAEQGGHGDVAPIRTALAAVPAQAGVETRLREVRRFLTPPEQGARLERAGFGMETMELIARPTPVTAGMEAWLETLAAPAPLPARLPEGGRRVAALAASALRDGAGNRTADHVRLREAVE